MVEEISKENLELWKTALNTQMHFNDLIMKLRAIVTSIITAVFGAAAIGLLSQITTRIPILDKNVHISFLIITVGIFLLIAYFILDVFYYFKLLLGAVKCSKDIEKKYPSLTLTSSINEIVTPARAYVCLIAYYVITLSISVTFACLIFFRY